MHEDAPGTDTHAHAATPSAADGRGIASRNRILDAAAEAFMERGYSATSIVDIADRLGATKGSVYHWYRSKAQIYLDVHMRAIEIIIDAVSPLADGPEPPDERLRRMLEAHGDTLIHKFAYQRVALQTTDMRTLEPQSIALQEVRRELVARRDHYEQLFADVIAEGIAAGVFRPLAPRFATKPVLGAMNWITRWYDPEKEDGRDPQETPREIAAFAVRGLYPAEAAARGDGA